MTNYWTNVIEAYKLMVKYLLPFVLLTVTIYAFVVWLGPIGLLSGLLLMPFLIPFFDKALDE